MSAGPETQPDDLGAAWAAAEAALPKGPWYISNVRRRSPTGRFSASATLGYSLTGESMSGFGATPQEALRALALRFSQPPFVTDPVLADAGEGAGGPQ